MRLPNDLYAVDDGSGPGCSRHFGSPRLRFNASPRQNRNPTVFREATKDRPLVIRDQKGASAHFARPERMKLLKVVDLSEQKLLVFAWRGSGQDRLTFSVLESAPEQVVFEYRAGRTRDLRSHVHVYALRSNVAWRTRAAQSGGRPNPPVEQYAKVDLQGKLNSRVVAIGGETTGIAVRANALTLELDFGRNLTLRNRAVAMHGKNVRVQGELTSKRGVGDQKTFTGAGPFARGSPRSAIFQLLPHACGTTTPCDRVARFADRIRR